RQLWLAATVASDVRPPARAPYENGDPVWVWVRTASMSASLSSAAVGSSKYSTTVPAGPRSMASRYGPLGPTAVISHRTRSAPSMKKLDMAPNASQSTGQTQVFLLNDLKQTA